MKYSLAVFNPVIHGEMDMQFGPYNSKHEAQAYADRYSTEMNKSFRVVPFDNKLPKVLNVVSDYLMGK